MEWRDIPSILGAKANSLGQVKLPERFGKMPNGGSRLYRTAPTYGTKRKAKKGAMHSYRGITYRGKNYKVHRLVCEAFHGPQPDGKPVVIHKDENGLNNAPANLKWGTQKENMNSPKFIEYCRGRTGENSPRTKWANRH